MKWVRLGIFLLFNNMWKYYGNNVNKEREGRIRNGFLTKAAKTKTGSPQLNIFKISKNQGFRALNKLPTYSHP